MKNPIVLLVDDRKENLISLEAILEKPNISLLKANSGEEALKLTLNNDIALVLLDVQMPEMDGFETAELMRGMEKTRYIPIIFVTAISKDKQHFFKGYSSGAVDYLPKPIEPEILKSKVNVFLNMYRQRKIIEEQNQKLNQANKTILKQQKSLVEEERMKVMLQMAGAAAHELNQPLMVLLGNIDLLEMDEYSPDAIIKLMPKIKKVAQRLSQTVQKIQTLDEYKTKKYNETTDILDIDNQLRILIVEDNDADYNHISAIVKQKERTALTRSANINSALEKLMKQDFDIILLDYYLPDGTGDDFLSKIDTHKIKTPVICISGKANEKIAIELLRKGVYDYLSKSEIKPKLLFRVIKDTLEKFKLNRDMCGAMEKMAALSIRDELTSLFNRRHMNEIIKQEFSRAKRFNSDLSCILLDIDHFKKINDSYGHSCGDEVLKEIASRITCNKRNSDYAFRYGGEEFLLLLPQTKITGAQKVAENIRKVCEKKPFKNMNDHIPVRISAGVSSIKNIKADTSQTLLYCADQALYQAKGDGRNCVKVFMPEIVQNERRLTEVKDKKLDYVNQNSPAHHLEK